VFVASSLTSMSSLMVFWMSFISACRVAFCSGEMCGDFNCLERRWILLEGPSSLFAVFCAFCFSIVLWSEVRFLMIVLSVCSAVCPESVLLNVLCSSMCAFMLCSSGVLFLTSCVEVTVCDFLLT